MDSVDKDPVLFARLRLIEKQSALDTIRRDADVASWLAGSVLTLAAIVVASVVALLAAASSSADFSVDASWSRALKAAALILILAAGGTTVWALHLQSETSDAAERVAVARSELAREERKDEVGRLALTPATPAAETLFSWAKSKIAGR